MHADVAGGRRSDAAARLVVFTRFPEAGRTKTRLIPALGPDRAAALHRGLAEHTLAIARAASARGSGDLLCEVRFTGGDAEAMARWLGDDLRYRAQPDGDLGARMAAASACALDEGARAVVIVGTDCPGLSAALVREAVDALRDHDVVLGPAVDGGYYLIGLPAPQPELFRDIAWGTDSVCAATRQRAAALGLSLHLLAPLDDVDRPDDLPLLDDYPALAPLARARS